LNGEVARKLEKASNLANSKLVVFQVVSEYLKKIGKQPNEKLIVGAVEKVPSAEFAKLQDLADEKTAFDKQLERITATVLYEYSVLTGSRLDR
jgi:hypothetical protein